MPQSLTTGIRLLQWGHGEFAVENSPGPKPGMVRAGIASMGPRRIRRGEPTCPGPTRTTRRPGFNGATANSPWRTRNCPGRARMGWRASMGPRRIRRGEPHNSTLSASQRMGFNGATANSPWRTDRSILLQRNRDLLQWGHGEFAVENGRRAAPSTGAIWLQWGHGEFAVENGGAASVAPTTPEELQWGHGEFAVENMAPWAGRKGRPTRFNGATANSPWRTTLPR